MSSKKLRNFGSTNYGSSYQQKINQSLEDYHAQEAMESFAFGMKLEMYKLMSFCFTFLIFHQSTKLQQKQSSCKLRVAKRPFCFPLILLPRGIGSRWNLITLKPNDRLGLPARDHLSGLMQRMWSYLTIVKGCRTLYLKSCGLHMLRGICKCFPSLDCLTKAVFTLIKTS